MSEVSEIIEREAAKPASMTSDAGSITRRPLSELIAVDRHLQEKEAASQRVLPIRFAKIVPGGAQ